MVPQQPPGVSLGFDMFGIGLDWSFVPLLCSSDFLEWVSPPASPAVRSSSSSVLQASEGSWSLSSASLGVLWPESLVLYLRGGTRVQPFKPLLPPACTHLSFIYRFLYIG
ncbi:hypothetical protein YC2023_007603 [Brassica napus]